MLGFQRFSRRLGAGAALLAIIFAPLAASAQDVPSYARPAVVSTDETVHGRIRSVDGAFNISVDDDRGFVDNVQLHQGTIINPTGLTLSAGMSVTILGLNAGATFDANEIDTPYAYDGPSPTPVYYGSGYWCPGFAYGYGPSFSLGLVIGGGGPWYYEHRPFHGRPWNGHAYFGPAVGRGAFAGRGFAGESRETADRFGTESTANATGTPRVHQEMRAPAPGPRSAHNTEPAHSGGGSAHARFGGGYGHGSSGGSEHGGGHAH